MAYINSLIVVLGEGAEWGGGGGQQHLTKAQHVNSIFLYLVLGNTNKGATF